MHGLLADIVMGWGREYKHNWVDYRVSELHVLQRSMIDNRTWQRLLKIGGRIDK